MLKRHTGASRLRDSLDTIARRLAGTSNLCNGSPTQGPRGAVFPTSEEFGFKKRPQTSELLFNHGPGNSFLSLFFFF